MTGLEYRDSSTSKDGIGGSMLTAEFVALKQLAGASLVKVVDEERILFTFAYRLDTAFWGGGNLRSPY